MLFLFIIIVIRHSNLQLSNDNEIWTQIYSTTLGKGGREEIDGLSVNAQYIRLYATKQSNNRGLTLYEFEVYGKTETPRVINSPTNMTLGIVTKTTAELKWEAPYSTAASSYNVYRDGVKVGTTNSINYTDTGLNANTTYKYKVEAVNADGKVSAAKVLNVLTAYSPVSTTSNINASADTKRVLKWMSSLTDKPDSRIIVGQFANHGDQINTANDPDVLFQNSYERYFTDLYNKTSKYPGMLAIDYEFSYRWPLDKLLTANQKLKEFWKKGGLVTINWTPSNPWTGNYAGDMSIPAGSSIADLINPNTAVYTTWHDSLKRIADGLTDLQSSGVTALWRPMQEMNGWFWYSAANEDSAKNAIFKDVWKDMYNYFTTVRGLNNLLWVYSPTCSDTLNFYPGDNYVDIIAPTYYSRDWNTMLSNTPDYTWV